MTWKNIRDLPEEDREPFSTWLSVEESSTYWEPDYERWKKTINPIQEEEENVVNIAARMIGLG